MRRILPSSISNHSLNALRGVGDPGRLMNTPSPSTTCASSSTSGILRPATSSPLKFVRPETQSLFGFAPGPGPGPGTGTGPGAEPAAGGFAGAAGGRKRPAGAGDPFSTRPQPACVSATVLS